jgi:hypothetical protein
VRHFAVLSDTKCLPSHPRPRPSAQHEQGQRRLGSLKWPRRWRRLRGQVTSRPAAHHRQIVRLLAQSERPAGGREENVAACQCEPAARFLRSPSVWQRSSAGAPKMSRRSATSVVLWPRRLAITAPRGIHCRQKNHIATTGDCRRASGAASIRVCREGARPAQFCRSVSLQHSFS